MRFLDVVAGPYIINDQIGIILVIIFSVLILFAIAGLIAYIIIKAKKAKK